MKGEGPKVSLQLVVADLDTTEAFYAGILDLPIERAVTVPGAPEYLVLKRDDWEVIFVEEGAVIRTNPVLEERFTSYPKGVGLTLHFRVVEIEEMYDALIEEGLEIFCPLDEKPYGMKDLWCFDPDGYLVVLEEPCG